jgi:uncharacterized metal-binding protein
MAIFWDATLCSRLKVNRRFGGTCCKLCLLPTVVVVVVVVVVAVVVVVVVVSRTQAGLNTSALALRVAESNEKRTQCLGV